MRISKLIFAFSICICMLSNAQNTSIKAEDLTKDAQTKYEQKEYTSARFLFKQAFGTYSANGNYQKAIECGLKVSALYHREFLYREAFDMCKTMDQTVTSGEQKLGKKLYDLRFQITKERAQMYLKLKNPSQSKIQLDNLEEIARQADSKSLSEELLYTKANFAYTFGRQAEGDACFKELISQYKKQKNYEKIKDCYKNLISIALRANNAAMVGRTYDQLIVWTETAKTLTAQDEMSVLKRKYNTSLQTIQDKEDSISAKQYVIVGLTTLVIILGVALVLLVLLLIKYIATSAKQKKSIHIANEHNELKSQFICNISSQMDPTLETLTISANELTGAHKMIEQIGALRSFSNHIQELTSLENSLNEPFELKNVSNIHQFCEDVIAKVKEDVKPGISIVANVTNLQIKTNTEQLERILTHLLKNAAEYTESGKITLEFMKRGAHNFQFIVTDTGSGIAAEKRENIFKPFSEIKDLTQGDGLGLPICALIALKLNGSLILDNTYTKGSRFILKLNA